MRLLLLPGCPTSRPRRLMPAVVDARQRNLMAAEFYGKEYVLFEGGLLNNAEGEGVRGRALRRSAAAAAALLALHAWQRAAVPPPST